MIMQNLTCFHSRYNIINHDFTNCLKILFLPMLYRFRSDTVQILTLFVGETENIQIKLWIIIASAIAGLILLLLLTIALVRVSFLS